jgi:ATP-dependent Clp protease protease subunit
MNGTIYITGEIGVDTTLYDVIQQAKTQPEATQFLVKIDSVGGYVDSGKEIYNYLKNLGKPVTTFTTKAYSIASMIFMAGSQRIIPEGAENAIMIHLPWMEVQGNHQVISDYLKELKAVEDELVDFYSKAIEIDKDTVHSLLKNETYLNASQAFELGFATQVQAAQLAVAKLNNNDKIDESLMKEIKQTLKEVKDILFGQTPAIKAELVLQDSTSVSIVFPDLAESDTPAVDDTALVDGAPAEGEFTMPDGTIFKFEKGVMTDVVAPVQQDVPADDTPEASDEKTEVEAKTLADAPAAAPSEELTQMAELIEVLARKNADLEAKYTALAKQIGSDFTSQTTEPISSLKKDKEEIKAFSIKRK